MSLRRTRMRAFLTTLSIVGLALATPTTARANHDSCAFHSVSSATGTLTATNNDDYWSHSASLTDAVHWIYLDNSGDADLTVYGNSNCTNTLCSSSAGGSTTDSCTALVATSTIFIRVHRFSGDPVNYTLSVCHLPRVLTTCTL